MLLRLYTTLAARGFFQRDILETFGKDGTKLANHVVRESVPGIEMSSGSGGHGLAVGLGIAMAEKHKGSDAKVFVLAGDAEFEEGSTWESLLFAGFKKIDNLKLIIDRNGLQCEGSTKDILDLEPLAIS